MATWIKKGDTQIGYHIFSERKKPVFGIQKGAVFMGYGQFRDKESAEQFMKDLIEFFNVGGAEDG